MLYYQADLPEVYRALKASEEGLASDEAAQRLQTYGPNRTVAGTRLAQDYRHSGAYLCWPGRGCGGEPH
jgi:hypothetical protein